MSPVALAKGERSFSIMLKNPTTIFSKKLEEERKKWERFFKKNPFHQYKVHIEQYLASFEENICRNTPQKIKKQLKEFYPEIAIFFENTK